MAAVYDDLDPEYAAICSEATLQSNVNGFFKPFVDQVTEQAERNDWLNNAVGGASGDRMKLRAVLDNRELMETAYATLEHIQPIYRLKSAAVSKEKREDAALAMRKGELQKALAYSSQAVVRAPMPGQNEQVDGGLSLPFALWLRSEVLMKQDEYELALRDLKLALKERLPAKERGEYYWRMGKCYKGVGELTKAKVSYDLAMRLIHSNPEAKAQLETDIEELKGVKPLEAKDTQQHDIPLASGAKQNMPSLSKLVKISEEADKGRFAVAGSSIHTGDVLLVEKPYASSLLPDYFGSHCCHCFKRLVAPVWCPQCSAVAFCSPECRDLALSTYHGYECTFVDLFIGSGMSILSQMALRMVTQAGLETTLNIHSKYIANSSKTIECATLNDIEGQAKAAKFKSRREKLSKGRKAKSSEKKNNEGGEKVEDLIKDENLEFKASQIYSLCTHADLRNPRDFLQRILMALFLVECLKKSQFFNGSNKQNYDQDVHAVLEVILRNLQLLQFNAHELYETVRSSNHKFNGAKARYIAVAIYPTAALFNHECYPSVARYFDGTTLVLRALRPLKSGDTIAENYGPYFLMRSLSERQRSLSCRYWFRCQCRACREDWPTMKQMDEGAGPYIKCGKEACNRGVRCVRKGEQRIWPRVCPYCGNNLSNNEMNQKSIAVNECIQLYQLAAQSMDSENVPDAIKDLCSSIDQFHEIASPPHQETHIAQESLRSCFADSGNVYILNAP